MNYKKFVFMTIILSSVLFSSNINYSTDSDIYGFQFNIGNVEILDVFGGAAEDAGFDIAYSSSTGNVVAFSMTGNFIPAGNGTLLEFEYEGGGDPCISELILSGSDGYNIQTNIVDCLTIIEVCHGNSNCSSNNIHYNTESDIYGFQFQISNTDLLSVYGGIAEEAGFQISYSQNTGVVVAFSMQGSFIPAGEGVLLNFEHAAGDSPCIENLIFSGYAGSDIQSYVMDCLTLTEGCEFVDECGICEGDGYSCLECEELSEFSCEESPYCDLITETVSCSGLTSSQCNAADGCSWTSSGGGDYGGGGSSSCTGGTGQINGACLAIPCNELEEMECNNSLLCGWENNECFAVGCTSPYADNYNPDATVDDGSCEFPPLGTLSFENYDYMNNTVEVHLNCEYAVSDFIFSVEGLGITGFYGGASEEANFDINFEENLISGSATSDSYVSADAGLLMILSFDSNDEQICFGQSEITTYIGITYEAVLEECVIPGCMDFDGCNYNINANANDFCTYPDCTGECGGGAILDDCGVCEGLNQDMDCAGICFGDTEIDCGGDCGGVLVIDACGECGGLDIECCPGDVNEDSLVDVLDALSLLEIVLEDYWMPNEMYCSDLVEDQILNVLDILAIVDIVLYGSDRSDIVDATFADINIDNGICSIASDGHIGGIQIQIIHGEDFSIVPTERALMSDYRTDSGITRLIVIEPETNEIFNASGWFEVEDIIVANSLEQISVYMNMPVCEELSESSCNHPLYGEGCEWVDGPFNCEDMGSELSCSSNDCEWIEDVEFGNCSNLSSNNCSSTPGCNWDYGCTQWGSWYTWICYEYGYECTGGTYQVDNSYCDGETGYCQDASMLGDVNGDDEVDILDIVQIVNLILNSESYNYVADMNNDGSVNVLDIIEMINVIIET